MKKLFIVSTLLSLALTSCLKDDNDVFDKSSSERMEAAIENALAALQSAPNGWRMEMYPEPDRIYGGYTTFAKFSTDGHVTVMDENFGPQNTDTSYYSVTADNGPMLTFDTYNEIFHLYSDPTWGASRNIGTKAEGLAGDSDFIVMTATPEFIRLKGRKSGNYINMYPLETSDWASEMMEYINAADNTALAYNSCEVDGQSYTVYYQPELYGFTSRFFTIYFGSGVEAAYVPTKTGIKFYEPMEIGGHTVTEMTLEEDYYLTNEDGSVKIFSPKPIRSNMTFQVRSTEVTYNDATIEFTPSISSEYYYWDMYPTSEIEGQSDKSVMNGVVSSLQQYYKTYGIAGICEQGTVDYSMKEMGFQLKPSSSYTVVVFGCGESAGALVSTTGLTRFEFTTDPMPELQANYKAWLGSWTVRSTSSQVSGSALTYPVEIEVYDPNVSFEIWNLSILALRESYAPIATWNSSANTFSITNGYKAGKSGDYDITYNAFVNVGNATTPSYTVLTGSYAAMTATKNTATTATLTGNSVSGYQIIGMDWVALSGSGWAQFTTAASGYTAKDYGISPFTMTKTADWSEARLDTRATPAQRGAGMRDIGRELKMRDYTWDVIPMYIKAETVK